MNIKEFAEKLGFDEEGFRELVEVFVETCFSDIEQLEAAILQGLPHKVAETCHSIKGAARSFRLNDIADQAEALELKAKQNILDGSLEEAEALRAKIGLIAENLR